MEQAACELRDVGERCSILLPQDSEDDNVWVIGLTIGSDLCSCQAESVLESDLIVTLLYVQRRSDGHWVTPHRDLPLVLNDEALETSMLLSNGSVLMVGGHTFTYLVHENPESELPVGSPTSPTHPPPKPKRHQRGSVLTKNVLSRSQQCLFSESDTMTSVVSIDVDENKKENDKLEIVYDKDRKEPDIEKSTELFLSIRNSVVNNDLELLEHIHTPEQMVNVCASYLLQFCVSSGLTLNTRDMDAAYQAMNVVCLHQPGFFFDFLASMKRSRVITEHDLDPFLSLFHQMLLICMDSMDCTLVSLRILVHFSQDPQHLPSLTHYKTQSLVCACMSVYNAHLQIQMLACQFMEHVTHNWVFAMGTQQQQLPFPVREAGLDLIVRAMVRHGAERPLLRPALSALVNVLRANTGQRGRSDSCNSDKSRSSKAESMRQEGTTIIDFLASKALPTVVDVYQANKDDREISEFCQELIDYYTDQDHVDEYASFRNLQTQTYIHNAETALSQVHTSEGGGEGFSDYDVLHFSHAQNSDEERNSNGATTLNAADAETPTEKPLITASPMRSLAPSQSTNSTDPEPDHPESKQDTQTGNASEEITSNGHQHQPIVSDDELNTLYAKVNKPKTKSGDLSESYKHTDMIENDLYGVNINTSLESLEIEGPELDYETRDFLNSQSDADVNSERSQDRGVGSHGLGSANSLDNDDIKPPSLHSISLDEEIEIANRKSSDTSIEIITPNELMDNVPRDWKTVKLKDVHTEEANDPAKPPAKLTRKLGKYFRKLKPKKKNKFEVPHDLDASQTYVAFEKCDSDFEAIDSESVRSNRQKPTPFFQQSGISVSGQTPQPHLGATLHSERSGTYEDALPVKPDEDSGLKTSYTDSTTVDTIDIEEQDDDYEDIRNFERRPSAIALDGNVADDGNLIYDLAGPCTWNDEKQVSKMDVITENSNDIQDVPLSNSHQETTEGDIAKIKAARDTSDRNVVRSESNDLEHYTISKSSNESLDSFIPNANDWDKVSQTSEDEFIHDATRGMSLETQTPHNRHHNERLVGDIPIEDDIDSVSLYSERSIDSRVSQVIPEDAEAVFEGHDDLDSRWSPQDSAFDYKTMKRVKDKKKSRKSNWVSALKQIYEKPQKKLSKSNGWKSNSCTNLTTTGVNSKQVLENPIYGGGSGLYKSSSTQSLDESGKKSSKRFRWRRKKSKDVIALPTHPSAEIIHEEGEDGNHVMPQQKKSVSSGDNAFRRNEYQTVRGKQRDHQRYPWHDAKKK